MTTTTTKETASAVGALDSATVRDQRFVGAKLLRTLAMQSNLQDELPGLISSVSLDVRYDSEDGGAFESALTNEWRTVMTWRAPRRPLWTTGQARLQGSAPLTVQVEWRILGEQGRVLGTFGFSGAGLGTSVTSGAAIELGAGPTVQRFTLQARGTADETSVATGLIGTPNAWTRSTNDSVVRQDGVAVEGANFNVVELRQGLYRVVAERADGVRIWARDVVQAFSNTLGTGLGGGGSLAVSPFLFARNIRATDDPTTVFRVVRRPVWTLESLALVGGNP